MDNRKSKSAYVTDRTSPRSMPFNTRSKSPITKDIGNRGFSNAAAPMTPSFILKNFVSQNVAEIRSAYV